jgi:NAD(P)-dependent dehydrogenase (short-subunit alcohol dehydrogenase family)
MANLHASAAYLHRLFGLDGLSAVVIGGTGTLGGAFCEALAQAGAYTYVVGRNREHGEACVARIRELGGQAEMFAADSTSRDDLVALRDHVHAAGRNIEILINGAGVNSATPFLEIGDEEWERILNINLRGVRLACQVLGGAMVERKIAGSIINIASVSSGIPLSRVFTYSLSKAAVVSLTKNLAREWAPLGIRVNALSPGFFPAEQNRKVLTPDRVAKIMSHTPFGRFGTPEELAGAILLMASPRAGSFLTGENIYVDGGFTAMTI